MKMKMKGSRRRGWAEEEGERVSIGAGARQNRCLGILIASSAIKNVERKIGN